MAPIVPCLSHVCVSKTFLVFLYAIPFQFQFPIMSNLKCPECGFEDIIIEDFIYVCTQCGNVVDDCPNSVDEKLIKDDKLKVNLNQNFAPVIHDYVNKYCWNFNSKKDRPSKCIKFGIDLIKTLCKNLNLSKTIQERAINTFKEVSSNNSFKYCTNNVKQCLALCCVYSISIEENNPITLTELANNIDFEFHHLGIILLRFQKICPELFKNLKYVESLVPLYLFKHPFENQEKFKISEYATELIWMWRNAVLIQGFNPINVIYPALFFSWKAIDDNRAKITLAEFCDKFEIEKQRIFREKVNYFYAILKDFTKYCPLLVNTVITKDTISIKIKDILSMKRIILYNYNNKREEINDKKRPLQTDDSQDQNLKLAKHFEDEEDFSDSEIDLYIRSPEEVKELEKLKDKEII